METYVDGKGVERCDNCGAPADDCACTCIECGDHVRDCACEEGPTYPAVADWARADNAEAADEANG